VTDRLVILAGGISSRMRRSAETAQGVDPRVIHEATRKAKSMIGVGGGGRPLMDYLLYNARESGFRDVTVVVGPDDDSIRSAYGREERDNLFAGLRISYASQPVPPGRTKPLGTADALLCALRARADWRGERFVVCNSDNLYSIRAFRALAVTVHPSAMIDYDRSALEFEASRVEKFAVVQKDPLGFLRSIVEKPAPAEITASADPTGRVGVSMNIFMFAYDVILPILERTPLHPVRQEKEIPTAVTLLVERDPRGMMTIPLAEHVPDLTHVDDIGAMRDYLMREFPVFSFGPGA
jgi:NDP-sugar pyrophosphorylase family protein